MPIRQVWKVRDLASADRSAELLERAASADRLTIDLTETQKAYANGAVPFAANLAYLRRQSQCQLVVEASSSCTRSIAEPLTLDTYDREARHTLTNSVWLYRTESEAQDLTNLLMDALLDQVQCEDGVIDSINWCLYEVMDNVFQHSLSDTGFVMMQLLKKQRSCAVTVGDTGIGIQKSLAIAYAQGGSKFSLDVLKHPGESVDYALQKGVTSKGGLNQGNGLFGLRRATELNGGRLQIRSGYGDWQLVEGTVRVDVDRKRLLPDREDHQGTLVDWQLDCSQPVRIYEALGAKQKSSDLLEAIEDDGGIHRISVEELEESLGSRKLGSELRLRLGNFLRAGARFIVLDFKGSRVVSSSFADEVLGKLAAEMGELDFRRSIRYEGVSDTNLSLIENAISQRLDAQSVVEGLPHLQ